MVIFSKYILVLLGPAYISLAIHAMDLSEAFRDAAQSSNITRIQELIRAGACVNTQNNYGWTVLMCATYYGTKNIAELLLKHRAAVNAQNKSGWTPLLYASMRGHKDGECFLKLILSKEKDR